MRLSMRVAYCSLAALVFSLPIAAQQQSSTTVPSARQSQPNVKEVDLSGPWMIDDARLDLKLNAEMSKVRKVYCAGDRMTQLHCLWVDGDRLRYEVSNQGFGLLNCSAAYEPDAPEMKGPCVFGNRPTPKGFVAKRLTTGAIAQGRAESAPIPAPTSLSPPSAAAGTEEWQSSWATFVRLHNQRLREGGDANVKQFVGKVVTWEGTFSHLANGKVSIDMGEPFITDGLGNAASVKVYSFTPNAAQIDKWRPISKGTRIRFRTTSTGGFFGNAVFSFMKVGSNNLAIVNTEGCELIEVLEAK